MTTNTPTNASDDEEHPIPKFCAPIDFGAWHLTVDGETTLCNSYSVESHHISGEFDLFDPRTDCTKCYRIYRTRHTNDE